MGSTSVGNVLDEEQVEFNLTFKSFELSNMTLFQGIIPRAIRQIFEEIAERKRKDTGLRVKVMVSFLEIYNEEIKDLLDHQPTINGKAKPITLRENVNGSIQVENAISIAPTISTDMVPAGCRRKRGARHLLRGYVAMSGEGDCLSQRR